MSANSRVPVAVDDIWPEAADADEGVVINWFAREGTRVSAGDPLCEIQVEKADADVPAPVDGTLVEIVCAEDEEFERGDTLGWIAPA